MLTNTAFHDGGRGPIIIGVLWTLTIIASSIIAARFYVRRKLKALYWDDWLMLMALMFQLVDISFITRAYSFGFGKRDMDLTFERLVNARMWSWLGMIPGTFVAVLARVSGAVFLIRLFGVRLWFKWYLIIFTTLQCIGGFLVLFLNFLGMHPVQALWNPTIKASRMDPVIVLYVDYVVQALFTFADLTYVLFPVMIIWRLNMSLGRKIALILLMCTSLLTAAASITKAWSCQSVSAELEEPQYASSSLALWAGVEQTLVIILGSISALCSASKLNFPFFNRFRSSIASLLGAVQQKKLSVSRNSYTQPDSYHDLERSSDNLGRLHVDTNGNYTGYFLDTTATRFKGGSRESLVIDKANKKCLAS